MVEGLLILSLLIWLPVLFYGIARQGFALILIWLLVAPVVVRIVENPGTKPFFNTEFKKQEVKVQPGQKIGGYLSEGETTVKLKDLLEPTRILFGIFFVVFLGDAVLRRRRLGPFDATEKFAFIFSLILIASALLQSKRTAYSLRVACDAFVIPFVAYFCARRLITSENQLRQLVRVIGYLGVYLIGIGLVERLTLSGFSRVVGPFEGRDQLYIVMAVVFFVVLVDSIRNGRSPDERRALPPFVQKFVLCFSPLIILFGWGRGNLVGLLSGIWIFVFLARRLLDSRRIMTMAGLVLLLAPIIAVGSYGLTPEEVVDARVIRSSTIYARFGAWQNIIDETAKSPVLGIGLNNLRDVLDQTRTSFLGVKSETHPHNSYMSMLAELGLFGFFVFLGIVVSIFRTGLNLYRTGSNLPDRWRGIAVIAIITAYLVSALFTNALYLTTVSHVYVYVLVGGIAGLYAKRRSVSAFAATTINRRWIAVNSPAGA